MGSPARLRVEVQYTWVVSTEIDVPGWAPEDGVTNELIDAAIASRPDDLDVDDLLDVTKKDVEIIEVIRAGSHGSPHDGMIVDTEGKS